MQLSTATTTSATCEVCQEFVAFVHQVLSMYLDIGEDMNVPDDFTATEMKTGMWWRHLVAGGIAGSVSRTCTAPLDRVKVHMQVHGKHSTTLIGCIRSMHIEGGFLSFWRGNGMNVLKIAPESALKFMAYEQAKKLIRHNQDQDLSIYQRFMAGSIAGGVSQSIIYPLETMKTRMALRKTGQYKSIADAAYQMFKLGGFSSFYRGYVPNLIGILPYAGMDLAVYETLKNMYLRKHGCNTQEAPSALLLLACGTVSSTCGQICSYPLALVRTRLQAEVRAHDPSMKTLALLHNILRKEGFSGLYRGITPNFLKVAPSVSISYIVYERCRIGLGCEMT